MNLKQRLCGFMGHRSDMLNATNSGKISHVKLKCRRCQFSTKWFETTGTVEVEFSDVDLKIMKRVE